VVGCCCRPAQGAGRGVSGAASRRTWLLRTCQRPLGRALGSARRCCWHRPRPCRHPNWEIVSICPYRHQNTPMGSSRLPVSNRLDRRRRGWHGSALWRNQCCCWLPRWHPKRGRHCACRTPLKSPWHAEMCVHACIGHHSNEMGVLETVRPVASRRDGRSGGGGGFALQALDGVGALKRHPRTHARSHSGPCLDSPCLCLRAWLVAH
jgi:hypothetical protein